MSEWLVMLMCIDRTTQSLVADLLRERGYEAMLPRSRAEAIVALALSDPRLTRTSPPSDGVDDSQDRRPDVRPTGAVFLKEIARKAAQRAERDEILKMLEQTRWNRVRAAKLLNISYRALLYKMKDAGLERTTTAGSRATRLESAAGSETPTGLETATKIVKALVSSR
jgi:DNA-binding NtrC family response regulator